MIGRKKAPQPKGPDEDYDEWLKEIREAGDEAGKRARNKSILDAGKGFERGLKIGFKIGVLLARKQYAELAERATATADEFERMIMSKKTDLDGPMATLIKQVEESELPALAQVLTLNDRSAQSQPPKATHPSKEDGVGVEIKETSVAEQIPAFLDRTDPAGLKGKKAANG